MRKLTAPYMELQFYFDKKSEQTALRDLIMTLLGLGAAFTGDGYVHRGKEIQSKPFAYITDLVRERVDIRSTDEFEYWLVNPDARLISVLMSNASGTTTDIAEVVSFISISEAASQVDRHPLSIWTDGDLFVGSEEKYEQDARKRMKVGLKAYKRFLEIVARLDPAYAAVTVEYSMECPTDLRRDPRSLAFNFYVSRAYVGESGFARIQNLYADAYTELVGGGLYLSTYESLNPDRRSLPREQAEELEREVVKILLEMGKVR